MTRALLYLVLLAALSSQLAVAQTCPTSCDCSSSTYQCISCLASLFRFYNSSDGSCPCQTGYQENYPYATSYCCSKTCETCSSSGCITCKSNAVTVFNQTSSSYICLCTTNYQLKTGSSNQCECKSLQFPQLYYNDGWKSCSRCPIGCTCDSSGCTSCDSTTNRLLQVSDLGYNICNCNKNYYENTNSGLCECAKGCSCYSNGTTVCPSSTNRYKDSTGIWICLDNYQAVDNQCVCQPPRQVQTIGGMTDCFCLSKQNISLYYQYENICKSCPSNCQCNVKGCYWCSDTANRYINGNTCPCKSNFTEVDGSCTCVYPFSLIYDNTTSSYSCRCLSEYDSSNFYYDQQLNKCNVCPDDCECDSTGCVVCAQDSNRQQTLNYYNINICYCKALTSVEINGVCQCAEFYTQVDNACSCTLAPVAYLDFKDQTCIACPAGCECSGNRCQNCTISSRVAETDINDMYSRCSCAQNFTEQRTLIYSLCVCQNGFQLVNGACVCAPYTTYNTNTRLCECLSLTDPSNYYMHVPTQTCQKCPFGCICNSSGCVSCSQNSLRVPFKQSNSSLFICQCMQLAILDGETCTICKKNEYYLNGNCMECSGCLTCNINGCTSCVAGQQLDTTTNTCQCIDPNKVNINGTCRCSTLAYTASDGTCVSCPNYCKTCAYDGEQTNCLTCALNSNRQNSPSSGCPCLIGYHQHSQQKQFCCSDSCADCNSDGSCVSCAPYTGHVLVNNSCICPNNTVPLKNGLICGCPQGYYLSEGECIICPPNCKACISVYADENNTFINCTVCQPDNNRQNSTTQTYQTSAGQITINSCPCLDGFFEVYPTKSYCYPQYCETMTKTCSKCLASSNRVPSQDGLSCVCPTGYFLSTLGNCTKCTLVGCLACQNNGLCQKCDSGLNYVLVSDYTCKNVSPSDDSVISQMSGGILVQFKYQISSTLNGPTNVQAQILPIVQKKNSSSQSLSLKVLKYNIQTNTITLLLSPLTKDIVTESVLTIYMMFRPSSRLLKTDLLLNADQSNQAIASYSIRIDKLTSLHSLDLSVVQSGYSMVIARIISILMLLAALILHIQGFKHNLSTFYIQSVGLFCFTMPDPTFKMIPTMYQVRYSWFGFDTISSDSLFQNIYFQKSIGNFSYLTVDSNFFRVMGIPVLFAICCLLISQLTRIIIFLLKKYYYNDIQTRLKKYLKPAYRAVEFFEKVFMYPLLFMSWVALINLVCSHQIDSGRSLYILSNTVALACPFVYLFWAVFVKYKFQDISRLSKYDWMIQYVSALLGGLILTLSYFNIYIYMLMIPLIVLKRGSYFYLRGLIVKEKFGKIWIFMIVLSESLTFLLVACLQTTARPVLFFFILTLVLELLFSIWTVREYNRNAKLSKNRAGWSERDKELQVDESVSHQNKGEQSNSSYLIDVSMVSAPIQNKDNSKQQTLNVLLQQ